MTVDPVSGLGVVLCLFALGGWFWWLRSLEPTPAELVPEEDQELDWLCSLFIVEDENEEED